MFKVFLKQQCPDAENLFILGDLFEAWIGDDNLTDFNLSLINALKELSQQQTKIYIMRGNRDFLLGHEFAHQTACYYLEDPSLLDLYGHRYLMMHGDTLCSNDVEYQKLRTLVRSPQWQQDFLAKSLAERNAIAQHLRQTSKQETSSKAEYIMDVDATTVQLMLEQYPCDYLIHGHTHRLAKHDIALNNKRVTRYVLGDWFDSGSCIKLCKNGPEFIDISQSH